MKIYIRGKKGEALQTKGILEALPAYKPLILFPSPDSQSLNSSWVDAQGGGPFHLIVPDGSWRQAKKVALREEAFRNIPRVHLLDPVPTQYCLRTAAHSNQICTMEAISRALEVLEGPREGAKIRAQLDLLFLKMVERIQWSRGKIAASRTTTGIPQAAFDAARIAGSRGRQTKPKAPID